MIFLPTEINVKASMSNITGTEDFAPVFITTIPTIKDDKASIIPIICKKNPIIISSLTDQTAAELLFDTSY